MTHWGMLHCSSCLRHAVVDKTHIIGLALLASVSNVKIGIAFYAISGPRRSAKLPTFHPLSLPQSNSLTVDHKQWRHQVLKLFHWVIALVTGHLSRNVHQHICNVAWALTVELGIQPQSLTRVPLADVNLPGLANSGKKPIQAANVAHVAIPGLYFGYCRWTTMSSGGCSPKLEQGPWCTCPRPSLQEKSPQRMSYSDSSPFRRHARLWIICTWNR